MHLIAIFCAGMMLAHPAAAQEPAPAGGARETLGYGRIFTNDIFGDGRDRWRTTSYAVSIVRGETWDDAAPARVGSLLEYRLRAEIIAPAALRGAGDDDRAYVGAVSAGLHTHFTRDGFDLSAGIDLVALGPQTNLYNIQDEFHDIFDYTNLSQSVIDNQVGDALHPTALIEISYPVQLNDTTKLRPFVEAQYGVEDLFRVGVDVLFGPVGQQDLWLRDVTTGQPYRGISGTQTGQSFLLGADYAMIGNSAYFPDSFGTAASDDRLRLRGGYHWQFFEDASFYYGLTYLGEEFVGQPEGQLVGSFKLNLNF